MRFSFKFWSKISLIFVNACVVSITIWKSRRFLPHSPVKSSSIQMENEHWHITEDGIYPLQKLDVQYNKWTKESVIPKKFYRNIPNVSKHNFQWVLNPHTTCVSFENNPVKDKLPEIFLLVAIASASWEFERRNLIRKTWASVQNHLNLKVKYVFFLGSGRNSLQRLRREHDEHRDTVVESFQESYINLTLKTQGQLKWVTYFCPNARFVMHADDDVFVDVRSVVEFLVAQNNKRLLSCGKVFMPKVRREGKWKMSTEEYRGKQYPKACVGWCFVMTQAVANELYYTSTNTYLIHLEDVLFTGILREKIKKLELTKLRNGEKVCRHLGWPKDRKTEDKLKDAWIELQENKKMI